MQNDEDNHLENLADQIIRYLDKHPDAADSIEGIVNWWLPKQRYIESVDQVYKALYFLIEKGEVSKKELADGHIIYERHIENNSH